MHRHSIYDVQVEVPLNGRRRGRRRRLGGISNNTVRPQPTAKVCCLANPNYAMTIRNDAVVLASANPMDDYQAKCKNRVEKTAGITKELETFVLRCDGNHDQPVLQKPGE